MVSLVLNVINKINFMEFGTREILRMENLNIPNGILTFSESLYIYLFSGTIVVVHDIIKPVYL